MANFLVSAVIFGGDRRSHRRKLPAGYRFARIQSTPVRGPLHKIKNVFRSIVEAIVDAKLRRMERELELQGYRVKEKRPGH